MEFKQKFFDPMRVGGFVAANTSVGFVAGGRSNDTYIYSLSTLLALNVALATDRPLLITGEPGSGKSTLARNAAAVLGWTYYEQVITSRSQAADLLWSFDALRRLNDAAAGGRAGELLPPAAYVEPGPVWWAFDPVSAAKSRGGRTFTDPGRKLTHSQTSEAVLLLDEIDKADPDVPNDLLEPFGTRSFTVRETGERINAKRKILLVLTSNGERELPPAFMRRCVVLAIEPPTREWFVEIATRKFGERGSTLYGEVADLVMDLRHLADSYGYRPAGTGEFLDAVLACRKLCIGRRTEAIRAVVRAAVWKQSDAPAAPAVEQAR